jgi:hypothetical protein
MPGTFTTYDGNGYIGTSFKVNSTYAIDDNHYLVKFNVISPTPPALIAKKVTFTLNNDTVNSEILFPSSTNVQEIIFKTHDKKLLKLNQLKVKTFSLSATNVYTALEEFVIDFGYDNSDVISFFSFNNEYTETDTTNIPNLYYNSKTINTYNVNISSTLKGYYYFCLFDNDYKVIDAGYSFAITTVNTLQSFSRTLTFDLNIGHIYSLLAIDPNGKILAAQGNYKSKKLIICSPPILLDTITVSTDASGLLTLTFSPTVTNEVYKITGKIIYGNRELPIFFIQENLLFQENSDDNSSTQKYLSNGYPYRRGNITTNNELSILTLKSDTSKSPLTLMTNISKYPVGARVQFTINQSFNFKPSTFNFLLYMNLEAISPMTPQSNVDGTSISVYPKQSYPVITGTIKSGPYDSSSDPPNVVDVVSNNYLNMSHIFATLQNGGILFKIPGSYSILLAFSIISMNDSESGQTSFIKMTLTSTSTENLPLRNLIGNGFSAENNGITVITTMDADFGDFGGLFGGQNTSITFYKNTLKYGCKFNNNNGAYKNSYTYECTLDVSQSDVNDENIFYWNIFSERFNVYIGKAVSPYADSFQVSGNPEFTITKL